MSNQTVKASTFTTIRVYQIPRQKFPPRPQISPESN
jgi:hypothetical protein